MSSRFSRCAVVIATLSTHLRWKKWRGRKKRREEEWHRGRSEIKRVIRWRRRSSERKEKKEEEGRKMRAEEEEEAD